MHKQSDPLSRHRVFYSTEYFAVCTALLLHMTASAVQWQCWIDQQRSQLKRSCRELQAWLGSFCVPKISPLPPSEAQPSPPRCSTLPPRAFRAVCVGVLVTDGLLAAQLLRLAMGAPQV